MSGFVANFVEGLGVMACSSNPNVNSSINNPLPTCACYDSNPNVDHVQPLHESGGLGNSNSIIVDELTIITMHLEDLRKQRTTQKPHYHNSPTWGFFKVNNN